VPQRGFAKGRSTLDPASLSRWQVVRRRIETVGRLASLKLTRVTQATECMNFQPKTDGCSGYTRRKGRVYGGKHPLEPLPGKPRLSRTCTEPPWERDTRIVREPSMFASSTTRTKNDRYPRRRLAVVPVVVVARFVFRFSFPRAEDDAPGDARIEVIDTRFQRSAETASVSWFHRFARCTNRRR